MLRRIKNSVFIILFLLLITGCAHRKDQLGNEAENQVFEEMKKYIKSNIQDRTRMEKQLGLVTELQQLKTKLESVLTQHNEKMSQLNKDYDATREDFQKLMNEYNLARQSIQQSFLSTYFTLKASMTQEEWKALAKIEEEALIRELKKTILYEKE